MAGEGVSLREYVEALARAQERRVDELLLLRRGQVDEQIAGLSRRLDESAEDRQHIRDALAGLVPRTEYDRVLGQALDRIGSLERTVARIYGGIAVVVLALSLIGVILRVVLG